MITELNNLIITTKRKMILLIIIIIICNLMMWYFLIFFNSIYKHNQLSWLQSTKISIIINIIIPFILCIICSILRFFSF